MRLHTRARTHTHGHTGPQHLGWMRLQFEPWLTAADGTHAQQAELPRLMRASLLDFKFWLDMHYDLEDAGFAMPFDPSRAQDARHGASKALQLVEALLAVVQDPLRDDMEVAGELSQLLQEYRWIVPLRSDLDDGHGLQTSPLACAMQSCMRWSSTREEWTFRK